MSLATLLSDAVGKWTHRPASQTESDIESLDLSDVAPDTRRLIRDRRYCRVLSNECDVPFDEVSIARAWQAAMHEMALIPGGNVCLQSDTAVATHVGAELVATPDELSVVQSLYLDRECVTNADFARFVASDGYSDPQYWPEEVLPNVLQFVDSSGHPGPKYWADGGHPPAQADHPVVGICWYEANAYATWVGKRLPSTEEWQRAGTWPKGQSGNGTEQRYPWGHGFDPSKANLWASGCGDTVPVSHFREGNTPNGVRQLIGNVWEWVDAQFFPNAEEGVSVMLEETMAEIRGGAFDTYFHSQATCQFRTGQSLLFRGPNVGFRCCISANTLPVPPDCQSVASPSVSPLG